MNYDLIVIGSGPGGYVAAIRASQLGLKTAVVEKESLGGVCLNWGCIPTKALLKSAQVFRYASHALDYGVKIEGTISADFEGMVKRSRDVASGMSNGVQFLFKKNKIDFLKGTGKIKPGKIVVVTDEAGVATEYSANHIILATGSRSRELPNLKQDGKNIIGYRQAMNLPKQPKSIVVVGSGAIGSEFAYFYNSIGTQVTLIELLPNIIPLEDEEVSKQLERSFKKAGIKVMTGAIVESVDTSGGLCKVHIRQGGGEAAKPGKASPVRDDSMVGGEAGKLGKELEIECEVVLSAVGIKSNLENIGLEEVGINVERDKIKVDEFYRTNVEGYYAIGDIVPGQALAHVASHEGITCVEKIAGLEVEPIDYNNIPGCTYTNPEVASVGYTEKQAREAGFDIKIGKFPYTASGKASASGNKEGFIKVIFDAKYGEWLGAHFIGDNVTEMIAEAVVARKLETTGHEIIKSVHPHPTMSEAVMEAVAAAYGEVIHI
jgi:dihydrolipoamide dehydrogenase